MFQRLARALIFRRLSRDLADIAASLRQQTQLLARLADHLAPADPPTARKDVQEGTGVSHLDENDAFLALQYMERTQRDTGHVPDDDEVLIYLADEKTQDLHSRLTARDAELQRLEESRQW